MDDLQNNTQQRLLANSPKWMSWVMYAAGAYNIIWAIWVLLFPMSWFQLAGLAEPVYPEIWQCVGMIVGVYGLGYVIAGFNPIEWWPLVLVGLIGKILGPIGFVDAVMKERFPIEMGWTILTNDLVWWVPFSMICWRGYREVGLRRKNNILANP